MGGTRWNILEREWVTKANATEWIERMHQDTTPVITDVVIPTEVDPIWEALADFPITLTMRKLLNLVPRFQQAMEARLQTPHKVIPTLFTEPNHASPVIDHQNPTIKVLVHGTEITRCVVDGGTGVNVISKAICTNLGIT